MKWAILGGGLTGIVLAHLLEAAGHETIVLEKEERFGGLCRSKTESGFTFDIGGSHILFSRDTEALDLLLSALASNRDQRHRATKIYYKGRYVKYPFENGLAELPKEDCFFCINEFIKTLIAAEKGELAPPENFRDWIYATFGKGIAETYMVPYNEKIWNFPAERMSAHWVEGRIPRPPVEDIIKSAVGIETEGYTHQAVFSYPVEGGIEALITALAASVAGPVRTGFAVRSVRRDGDGFAISDGSEVIRADRCISTIPVQALLPCCSDVPPAVRQAADSLQYNSLCCVCIGVKGEVPPYSWLYVPEKELGLFNRVSFPSGYSTRTAPPGHSSVLVEITYNAGDAADAMSDDAITAHAVDGLAAMGILDPADVVYTSVERQQFAYVVYDLAYRDNIAKIRAFCRERGIDCVGRFSEFEYLNMDGCVRHAIDFVRGL
ncbi:MAG: NAD(P)-binding protein [Methanomicrobiales archaeon]|nr:NAD(P)-binding protein [Methanomicrobiales archaeon]